MIYAPPEVWYGPDGKTPWGGLFNLWHADVEGKNRVFLGQASLSGEAGKPGLVWSPGEDFVIVDVSYDAAVFYLAKTDGSFFQRFPSGQEVHSYLRIPPRFSGDEEKIAFVGTTQDARGMHHATWVATTLNGGRDLAKLSDHIGLLQWSPDSRYLYILDIVGTRTLFRVDLSEAAPREEILVAGLPIPAIAEDMTYEAGLGLPDMYNWALSPDEAKIVYRGADGTTLMWGILQVAPER